MTRLIKNTSADTKVIFALFMVHFVGDFYSSFIGPLLPVFKEAYSLSLTQVGVLAAVTRLLSFLVQPMVGYAADRTQTRFYVLAGPLLPILFIPLTGVANSFWLLLILVAVASIGSSMFHPTAAGMVSAHAGRHTGFCLSIFNMGGTFAFGAGPLVIAWWVETWGLSSSVYTMFFGLAVMVWLFAVVPTPQGEGLSKMGFWGSLKTALGPVWRSVFLVWLVMVLRSVTSQAFLIFMPLLYADKHFSLTAIGLVLSIFVIAGSVSGLVAGGLADRYGFKPLFYACMGISPLFLILLLHAGGAWIYPASAMAGFFILSTLPLGLALGQKLAPKGRSMVSSLMMGLAYGLGGMVAPIVGKLADLFSISVVLFVISFLPLATLPLMAMVKEPAEEED